MKKIFFSFFLSALFLESFVSIAQQDKEVSLLNFLKTAKEDTTKVNSLIELAVLKHVTEQGNPCKEALALAKKLNFKRGQLNAAFQLAGYHEYKSDFQTSLKLHEEICLVAEGLKDTALIHKIYGGIYNACLNLGNYPKALDIAIKGSKLAEASNKKILISNYYNLIACVHGNQNNIPKAKEYFTKYLTLAKEINNPSMLANAYLSMASMCMADSSAEDALVYLNNTLEIYNQLAEALTKQGKNNSQVTERIAFTYNTIASIHSGLQDYSKALPFSKKCLAICYDIMGGERGSGINLYDLATYYINYGEIYTGLNNYEKAEEAIIKGLIIALEIPHKEDIKLAYHALSELYLKQKNYEKAFEYHKKYSDVKDSLLNEAVSKQMAEMNTRYESEKKDKELIQKDAEIKNEQLENKHQSTLRNAFIIGFALVALLALFILRSYSLKKRANVAISRQKELIEEKNKEITDSIHYAKRIQKALLASDNLLDKNLAAQGHEYFVFYKPKDIVSGDFYWARQMDNKFLICTADCTGHGVPGAFMSLLNISFLNETTIEKKISRPDLVLNTLRTSIINTLNTDGNEESKDGMDCILCTFDFENNKMEYAAANNTFYLVRNNELILSNADKMPVGKSPRDNNAFTLHTVDLQKGDVIFTITDGYADQFGGIKGKKFKYKQLEEILISNHQKPLKQQSKILEERIESWRGDLEQVDDILIIGIKI